MATAHTVTSFRLAAKDFLNDDQFSDFTIVCEGKEFKVHRCFISIHSPYFKRACAGMFKESQDRKLELVGDFKEVVERMITFFYTFDYDDTVAADSQPSADSGRPQDPMQLNAFVYATAEKYQVENLKSLALEKFKNRADFTNSAQMATTAKVVFQDIRLPEKDLRLKEAMVSLWILGAPELDETMGQEKLTEIVADVPELAAIVFSMLAKGIKGGKLLRRCPECRCRYDYKRTEVFTTIQCRGCKSEPEASKFGWTVDASISLGES